MRVTIKDVARLAGVSISTASVALRGGGPVTAATRRKVEEAAARLHYRPNAVARSLVTSRSQTLGLVIPDITDPYFHGIVKGVESTALDAGYTVILYDCDRRADLESRAVDVLLERRVDGLLFAGAWDVSSDGLRALDVPVVVVGRDDIALPAVTIDQRRAGHIGTCHLLDCGHTSIGYINGPSHVAAARERFAGYREALRGAGLEFDDALIETGDFQPESGYLAARRLFTERTPTALFAANDQMAFGAMHALRELGFNIPGDVAVVGVGDIPPSRYVYPPLTTVAVPLRALGAEACRMMLHRLDGHDGPAGPVYLDVDLRTRGSSAVRLAR